MSVATPDPRSPQSASRPKPFVVAVAGNPNCGKTTLFNALTGLRHKVGNYPGVTVEKREGVMLGDASVRLLDLPGTYSLSAQSPDEQIARDVILGHVPNTPKPDAVLIVVDAANLERNLYLATQIIELGMPAVIACNMMDLVDEAGHRLNVGRLSRRLGVPIVPTVGHRRKGLQALREAIRAACDARPAGLVQRAWQLGESLEQEVHRLARRLADRGYAEPQAAGGAALLLFGEGDAYRGNHLPVDVRCDLRAALDRLAAAGSDVSLDITVARYAWLGDIVDECLERSERRGLSLSDRLDAFFTHRVWGLLSFGVMMAVLFWSIFIAADPLMTLIEDGVGTVQSLAAAVLPAGPLEGLVTDGVIAGVGNVVVFFPQICILFLFIALLEDTGYMARAAFLMDRIMSRVGLHGKSFIPLLSSHACAIPGIMATRTIESPRDRLVTILVAPLMSCSARLPVYTVLIAACLPGSAWVKAGVLLSMYGLGIAAALTMATIFKKTFLRGPTPAFIMELPPYRVPRPGAVLRVMWDRSKLFLRRAGTVILAITVVLWALMNFPKDPAIHAQYEAERQTRMEGVAASSDDPGLAATVEDELRSLDRREASTQLKNSYAGKLGHLIEPLIRPLGFDWKIGIGIVASFAAREVFVGTMAVVYSVGDDADAESTPLRDQMRAAAWPDGSPVYSPLVAVSLMVFYVLACQCISTIAVVRRETNSWRWPIFMFAYMTVLAYCGAMLVYQVGTLLHLGTA